jgi:hypothetical protein
MNTRAFTILAALAAAAAGCVPNDASVRLYGLCSAPIPDASGGCLYPAKCATLVLGRLLADVSSPSIDGPLVWPVQVNNQRQSNADRAGGVETAFARIEGFKVKYASATLAAFEVDVRSVPAPTPVDPGGTSVILLPVIPQSVGTFLSGQITLPIERHDITAEVRAYGSYGDGSSFETGPMDVEATLCNGCIADPFTNPAAYCPADEPVFVGVCPQEFQTGVVTCKAAAP